MIMARILRLSSAITLLVCSACGSPDPMSRQDFESGPALVVSPLRIDHGVIGSYARVASEVTLENIGDAPVTIQSAFGSCKCLVLDVPTEAIQPGDSVNMTIEFNPSTATGPYEEPVVIKWSDEPGTEITVTVIADVQDTLQLSRRYVGMVATPKSFSDTKAIEVSPIDAGQDFEVTSVEVPDYMAYTVENGSDGTKNLSTLRFSLTAAASDLPIGMHESLITVRTTNSRQSTIHLDATVSVEPSIRVKPATIFLNAAGLDGPYYFTATVQGAGNGPTEIRSIESDFDGLEYTIADSLEGGAKMVEFQIPSRDLIHSKSGSIRLHGSERANDFTIILLRVKQGA